MIEYIKGTVDEITPTKAILEASGIGYALNISLNTYTAIQNKKEAKLYVYEVIREDAYLLFGFATRIERDLFELLLGVSGIGGQTARMVLSAFTPADLANIVQTEDVRSLKGVKGIGPKAAQRIIVDLKDKVASFIGTSGSTSASGEQSVSASSPLVEEAVQALTVLGFSPAPTQKVVMQIVKEAPDTPVEGIIKKALKMLWLHLSSFAHSLQRTMNRQTVSDFAENDVFYMQRSQVFLHHSKSVTVETIFLHIAVCTGLCKHRGWASSIYAL